MNYFFLLPVFNINYLISKVCFFNTDIYFGLISFSTNFASINCILNSDIKGILSSELKINARLKLQ